MRHIALLIIFFLLAVTPVAASDVYCITKEHNLPRTGDVLQKDAVEFFENNIMGDECFWDFSNIEVNTKSIKTKYKLKQDGRVVKSENREQYLYSIISDSLKLIKQMSPSKSISFALEKLVQVYPISFGETAGGYFYGEGTADYFNYARVAGRNYVTVVGRGRMITPDNDSLRHVLLVKEVCNNAILISPDFTSSLTNTNDSTKIRPGMIDMYLKNDSITSQMETHLWYARGYRYPILESYKIISYYKGIKTDSISEMYYVSPHGQKQDLDFDAANDSLRQIEANETFDVPFNEIQSRGMTQGNSKTKSIQNGGLNDSNIISAGLNDVWCELVPLIADDYTMLNYRGCATGNIKLKIYSSSGSLMWQYENSREQSSGSIDCFVSEFVAGEYVLQCQIDNKQYIFKFIKK